MKTREELKSNLRTYQYTCLFILGFCIGYLVGGVA